MTLRTRLMLSVAAVVLVSLAAVFVASTRVVKLQFERLRSVDRQEAPERAAVVRALEEHHRRHGWRGVQPLLARLRDAHAPGRELLLVDPRSRLIAASSLPPGGLRLQPDRGGLRISYRTDGEAALLMVTVPDATIGPADAPVASVYFVSRWRSRTLAAVRTANRWLLLVVAVTGVLALLLVAAVSRNIVRPIEELQQAVQRIEEGDLGQQVAVASNDEVGKLARAFNAMSAQLERDEVLRRNMVNDVAHELRTPLTNLICAVEALQDGLRQPTPAVVDALRDDLALLQRLIDDLQTLALAEARKLPLHVEAVDVREEVERCIRAMPDADRQRIEVGGDPVRALADRTRFQQIVANLLRNALIHGGAGGRIRVTSRAVERGVELVVADDGPGIGPEHLPHVFDRFYRADPSRHRTTGGAGLGLAIVKNLVELHGGRIEVDSADGRGASFRVELPAAAGG